MTKHYQEMKEDVIKEIIKDCEQHIKKYGHRKMTLKELDRLCEIKNA